MDPADPPGLLEVHVAYSPGPQKVEQVVLRLPPTATVHEALRRSGLLERHALRPGALTAGIWGRVCPLDTPLRDRDRVEIYRPLRVDPKEARRLRYKGRGRSTAKPPGAA